MMRLLRFARNNGSVVKYPSPDCSGILFLFGYQEGEKDTAESGKQLLKNKTGSILGRFYYIVVYRYFLCCNWL